MKYPKRSQYKYAKKPYRVRNWRQYEAGLRQRGDLTIWITQAAIDGWQAPRNTRPGGQRVYSRIAIETALTVRMVYHLPLRQVEGFLGSIFELLGLALPAPDHTTISRRSRNLGKLPISPTNGSKPAHLLIDSTGVRIHVGNMRKPPKRRAWRKLHLAVDRDTGDILGVDLTSRRAHDACRVLALLKQVEQPLASASADGAYDTTAVYEEIAAHSPNRPTKVIIPPHRDALLSPKPARIFKDRNRHIRSIDRIGRRKWHKMSGYTKRSLVENSIYRYKAIIGREMRARTLAGQRVEARMGCRILNRMTNFGMPESYRIG